MGSSGFRVSGLGSNSPGASRSVALGVPLSAAYPEPRRWLALEGGAFLWVDGASVQVNISPPFRGEIDTGPALPKGLPSQRGDVLGRQQAFAPAFVPAPPRPPARSPGTYHIQVFTVPESKE